MNEFADIHIRWNNGQDLLLNVSLYDDNMGAIKQLVICMSLYTTTQNPYAPLTTW